MVPAADRAASESMACADAILMRSRMGFMRKILGWVLVLLGIALYAAGQVIPATVSVLLSLGGMVAGGVGGYFVLAAKERNRT